MGKTGQGENPLTERYKNLVRSLINSLELRNPYNVDHCRVVSRLTEQMARKAKFSRQSRQLVVDAAQLHTLGVSLQMEEKKPYFSLPITNLGLSSGREHPSHVREEQLLREILDDTQGLEDVIKVIIHRHEWFDGSASFKAAGEEVSEESRLLAVADAFVELCTPKKHRSAESSKEAMKRIEEASGSQFDPKYVEILKTVITEEEGFVRESTRAAHFETSRCRHYLYLGHLSTAMHETSMALRSYLRAEKMAVEMSDSGLQLAAISGQVMVYCNQGHLEMARDALQRARTRTHSEREKRGYHLMWGMVEWLSGREQNGYDILDRLAEHYRKDRHLPALTASLIFQSYMLLKHRGLKDDDHLDTLEEFLELVGRYDLFDIVERYRSFTVPLFLSAAINDMEVATARTNLTKMGEPCQKALLEKLSSLEPSQWMNALLPEPVVPTPENRMPVAAPSQQPSSMPESDVIIQTLGGLTIKGPKGSITHDDWPTQKAMRMFSWLAVTRAPIAMDMILEDLWPEVPEKKAQNSLRNAIHQIRTLLKKIVDVPPKDILQKSRKLNTFTLGFEYVLDVEHLEHYLNEVQEGVASNQAIQSSKRAVDLCQGEFLEGLQGEWLDGIRARYKEMEFKALATLGKCYLDGNLFEEAEMTARRILASDDLREDAYEIQLHALIGDGRSAEAIRLYEETVALFEQEIGVVPSGLNEVLKETGLLL